MVSPLQQHCSGYSLRRQTTPCDIRIVVSRENPQLRTSTLAMISSARSRYSPSSTVNFNPFTCVPGTAGTACTACTACTVCTACTACTARTDLCVATKQRLRSSTKCGGSYQNSGGKSEQHYQHTSKYGVTSTSMLQAASRASPSVAVRTRTPNITR